MQTAFVMVWLANLARTDAYFSIYVLIGFFSFYVKMRKMDTAVTGKQGKCIAADILSILFTLAVLLSNYSLFTVTRDPERVGRSTNLMLNLCNTTFSFIGGICVAKPVLEWFFFRFPKSPPEGCTAKYDKYLPVFFFLSIVALNLVHLFLVEYPGNLTEDTFTQISEMVSGKYSNFNTFWHTVLFQSILSLGYGLFGNGNASVAFFCVFQILVMGFAFTYCLMTMYHYGIPRKIILAAYLVYAILPYNLALSITIWKDVLFGAGLLIIISSLMRIMGGIPSKHYRDHVAFALGSLLFIVSRTNGWIIYLIFFAVYALFVRKNRGLLAIMGTIAVIGWVLLNPVLSWLHIPGTDKVESLSVPIQQISRVIADGRAITAEESELLSKVIDLDDVPELYTNWLSDPMKVEFRSKDQAYLEEHLSDYAKLWWKLGLRYPIEYGKAWIDQTKGYWNAGYPYAMYSETVTENPYGVEKTAAGNPIASLFRLYFGLSRHIIFFEPLHSIGLHVWITILCFIMNILKRRREFVLSVPLLCIVVGLWLGTPVYCCFRYIYPLFVSFPLIVSTTLFSQKWDTNQSI